MPQAKHKPLSFLSIPRTTDLAIHPSGEWAMVTRACLDADAAKRVSELWSIDLNGQQPPALVQGGDHGSHSPRFASDGSLYFLSKRDTPDDTKNELDQVWRQKPDNEAEVITDEPCGVLEYRIAANTLVVLAPVLRGVVHEQQRVQLRDQAKNGPSGLMYTEMNVRDWDHWIGDAAPHLIAYSSDGKQRRDLCPKFDRELRAELGLPWDLSPCGTKLAVACWRPGPDRIPDSSILLIDTNDGCHRHLGKEERVTHCDLHFSDDGSQVAAVWHKRQRMKHGPHALARYELAEGTRHDVATGWDCVPSISGWHGNDALLVTAPAGGQLPVYRVCLRSNEVDRITGEDVGGSHSNLHCHGSLVIGLRHTFQIPPQVFRMSLQASSSPESCTALSAESGGKPMRVESLLCAGDGGTPVQYFFLSPLDRKKGACPTILWIHGGPVSAWTDAWHWRWNPQPFVDKGYNVVLANPRGSTGFGQGFIEGVSGNQWGAAAYSDLMCVMDQVCQREDVDSNALAAMGGSFGGYMSNWIGTQTDRFAAIITHASLYRLSAFHGTTDYPAYWEHDMGVHPSDSARFDRYSPHRHIEKWKTPVLITHGERDYRVPISEALMLFEDLRRQEVDAKLLVFPDENHWILKPRNAEQWYRECLQFLEATLEPTCG